MGIQNTIKWYGTNNQQVFETLLMSYALPQLPVFIVCEKSIRDPNLFREITA